MTITKFGNKTRSLRTKQSEHKLDSLRAFYYDILLLTAAYSDYAGHFFQGQFPNMDWLLLLLLFYVLLKLLYFPRSVNITLFLTGCLCALNYMSKPANIRRSKKKKNMLRVLPLWKKGRRRRFFFFFFLNGRRTHFPKQPAGLFFQDGRQTYVTIFTANGKVDAGV